MIRALLYFAMALALSGCHKTMIVMDSATDNTSPKNGPWHHSLVFGLVELSDPIQLDSVCPTGVSHIKQHRSVLNALAAAITFEIYSGQTVSVYCRSGIAAHAVLDERGMVTTLMPMPPGPR